MRSSSRPSTASSPRGAPGSWSWSTRGTAGRTPCSTELILRGLGLEPPGAEHEAHSEAELRMLLSSSAEQGEIEHEEQEMLSRVFDFADKQASDVMVARPEVVALSIELAPEE